jgi:hypothetical protein
MLWFVIALLLGGAAGWVLQDYFTAYLQRVEDIAREDPEEAFERILAVLEPVFGIMAFMLLAFALYLARLGLIAVRTARFPPPGAWIVEGRRTLEGTRAKWAGWTNILGAIVLTAFAFATVYYTWVLLPRLFASALGTGP